MKHTLNRIFIMIALMTFISVLFVLSVSAKGEELLKNGGFESGIEDFITENVHFYDIVNDVKATGDCSCKVYNRNKPDESVKYDITHILKDYGYYKFSVYLMLDEADFDYSLMRGIITVNTDKGVYKFKTPAEETVNNKFTLCERETCIKWDGNITSAYFSVENVTEGEMTDFYVDGFSLKYIRGISANENTGRSEEFLAGAIRCDDISQKDTSVLAYGIKKRALPYWFDFKNGTFADYSQVVAKDEIYASYAGINYFAYRPEDGTYIFHTGKINMCFVFGEETEISEISLLSKYFASDKYQKYNGKNLVIFTSDKNFDERVQAVKNVNAGVGKQAVILLVSENSAAHGQADLVAVKSESGEDVGQVFRTERNNWSEKTLPYASAGISYGSDREKVADHICAAVKTAKQGMNAMLFPWNDCKGGNYTVPVYKTDNGANRIEEKGEYLLDTYVIDRLHSELSGENIIIERTVQKDESENINSVPNNTPLIGGNGNSSGGNNVTTTDNGFADNLPDSTEVFPQVTANTGKDGISGSEDGGINGNSNFTEKGNSNTDKNAGKEDGGEKTKYTNRNKVRNIAVALSVTAVLLGGALTYKVITEKKKNEKKD